MSAVWNWILARLKEPSTWAGLGLAGTAVASGLQAGLPLYTAILGGVAAILIPEKSS